MDGTGHHAPNLDICLEQIRNVFDVQRGIYNERISKLEEEKLTISDSLKKKTDFEKECEIIVVENRLLKEEVDSLRTTIEQSDARFLEMQLKYKALRRNVVKKQSEWDAFLEKFQKHCKCKFKDKIEKLRRKDESLSTPNVKGSNVSKVFFMSPVKRKTCLNVTPLAPMTEMCNDTNSPKASTPVILGETEKFPFMKDESNSEEVENVWCSSPPLVNEQKDSRQLEKSCNQTAVSEISSVADDIVKDLVDTNETSVELFSETLYSNPSGHITKPVEQVEPHNKPISNGRMTFKETGFLMESKLENENAVNDEPSLNVVYLNKKKSLEEGSFIVQSCGKFDLVSNGVDNHESLCETSTKKSNYIGTVGKHQSSKVNYKYDTVVRKKREREKLSGHVCDECRRYYESDDLSKEKMEAILKECSRHKHICTPPPSTPNEFWSIGFPSTQEYIDKGYMLDENETLPDHAKPKWKKMKKNKAVKYQ